MLSCVDSKQWKMTCLSNLGSTLGEQGNFVYLSVPEEGGALCLGKIASFILTFKNDVFSCLQGVPEVLPKLLSEKPNPTHPGQVCTIPSWTWGPCSGVSAPLSLGLRPYIILDACYIELIMCVEHLMIQFKMYCLKCKQSKTNVFKKKREQFLRRGVVK